MKKKRKIALFLVLLMVASVFLNTTSVFATRQVKKLDFANDIPLVETREGEMKREDPTKSEESLNSNNDLELGDEIVHAPVGGGQREEIHIRTKDELLKLLNTVYYQTASGNNNYRYGVENTDIYLGGDFTISSDEINAPITSNSVVELRHNSFYMTNSSFYGQGHTITIEKGTRDMYSLFGDLSTNNKMVDRIKDLNIVYKGDVIGSGFARNFSSTDNKDSHLIENINITVNGNILPFVEETASKRKIATSSGFIFGIVSTKVDKVNINVSGNIGLENPVADTSDLYFVYSRSAGFMINRVHRFSSQNNFRDITNLDIKVGGSILAGSTGYYAEADGIGHDIQAKNFKNIKLHVGGDIKAVVNGDYKAPFTLYKSSPITASAIGYQIHHLENLNVNIGGSVIAINNGDLNIHTMAMGIGRYDYENDLSDDLLKTNPLTIKNVNLNVGGNISATANKDYRENDEEVSTYACAGFLNDMDSGLENYDVFEGNTINVNGNVESNNKAGYSDAWLWGYFMGDGNSLSANRLIAKNESGSVYAAPFKAFVKGQKNKVTLNSDIIAKGKWGKVGGFAESVTKFDGIADGNKIDIKGFDLEGIGMFGGFAAKASKHKNQPDVEIDVKNVDLSLGNITISSPVKNAVMGGFISQSEGKIENCKVHGKDFTVNKSSEAYTGGFTGNNTGDGKLNNNIVYFDNLNVKGSGSVGGYVGLNSGEIDKSFANVKGINFDGDGSNGQMIGGFLGFGYGGSINNSGAFVEDSITATKAGDAYLGGFAGVAYGGKFSNDASQVGENITSLNNKGAANIGGFAGNIQAYIDDDNTIHNTSVDNSTSLVFGDIKGESNVSEEVGIASGFVGYIINRDKTKGITNSASYVGGKLEMTGQNEKKYVANAVGVLEDATLKGFTVLGNITDNEGSNKSIFEKYVAEKKGIFEKNFVTEVKGGNRKAFLVTKSGNKFVKESELGQIDIAARAFQEKYWDKDLSSVNGGKENFVYVEKNDKDIVFTPIATGLGTISTSPFNKAALPDFYTRHLALLSNIGPIYDILGIPAGKPKPEPEPEPKPEPEPEPKPKRNGYKPFFFTAPALNKEDHYQYLIGYKDNTFRPENNMTREEVAVMFSRLLKNPPIKGEIYNYNFSDVERERWSTTAISYMSELGIINGYPDGTFRPQASITRAEFASIAAKFAELKEGNKTFSDLGRNHWAYDIVSRAATAGWINGYPDGTFKPANKITRAEVVSITNLMMNRKADEKFVDNNLDKLLKYNDVSKNHWAYYKIFEATNGHDFVRQSNKIDEEWKDITNKSFVYDK